MAGRFAFGTVQNPSDLLNQLRDHLDPEEPTGGPTGSLPWLWLVLGAVALLGLVVLARWLRKRRGARTAVPPAEAFLRELDALEADRLPERGEIEAFHVRLAEALRRYLEQTYQVPASRQTTQEFLAAWRTTLPLGASEQDVLAELLRRCDLAKFARSAPGPEVCGETLALARRFAQSPPRVGPAGRPAD
jgi:Domain of unknown function (DUF4381)